MGYSRTRTADDLDTANRELFFDQLASGASLKDCCRYAGIAFDTVQQRRIKDAAFSDRVMRGLLETKNRCLRVTYSEVEKGNWRAATWYLEKAYPEEYGHSPHGQPPDPREVDPFTRFIADRKAEFGVS